MSDFKLEKAGLMIAYSNQQTKNGQFKKIKFLTIIRLNSNGGQFYKKNYKI